MIRLLQYLCPNRHCIMALSYDSQTTSPETARALLVEGLQITNPWCGICYSRDLSFEDKETIFETMAEAEPVLKEEERKNLESRRLIDSIKTGAKNN